MPSLTLFAASLKMYITHKSKIIISQTTLLSSKLCLQCTIDYALYKLISAKKYPFAKMYTLLSYPRGKSIPAYCICSSENTHPFLPPNAKIP